MRGRVPLGYFFVSANTSANFPASSIWFACSANACDSRRERRSINKRSTNTVTAASPIRRRTEATTIAGAPSWLPSWVRPKCIVSPIEVESHDEPAMHRDRQAMVAGRLIAPFAHGGERGVDKRRIAALDQKIGD